SPPETASILIVQLPTSPFVGVPDRAPVLASIANAGLNEPLSHVMLPRSNEYVGVWPASLSLACAARPSVERSVSSAIVRVRIVDLARRGKSDFVAARRRILHAAASGVSRRRRTGQDAGRGVDRQRWRPAAVVTGHVGSVEGVGDRGTDVLVHGVDAFARNR